MYRKAATWYIRNTKEVLRIRMKNMYWVKPLSFLQYDYIINCCFSWPMLKLSEGTISIPMLDNSSGISLNSKPNKSKRHVGHRKKKINNGLSSYAGLGLH